MRSQVRKLVLRSFLLVMVLLKKCPYTWFTQLYTNLWDIWHVPIYTPSTYNHHHPHFSYPTLKAKYFVVSVNFSTSVRSSSLTLRRFVNTREHRANLNVLSWNLDESDSISPEWAQTLVKSLCRPCGRTPGETENKYRWFKVQERVKCLHCSPCIKYKIFFSLSLHQQYTLNRRNWKKLSPN